MTGPTLPSTADKTHMLLFAPSTSMPHFYSGFLGIFSQCASWVCWALLTGVSGQDGGLLEGSCKDTVILNTKSSKAVPVIDMY